MARKRLSSLHLYIAVIVVTTILALLPLRLMGWVNDVASVARLPALPLADLGMRARHWLGGDATRDGVAIDDVAFLQTELDRYRSLANQWRSHAEDLADTNAQLQHAQVRGLDVPFDPVNGDIIGRNTQSDRTAYELNVGSYRHSIREGAVAVYNGVHLVGRIGSVSRLSSILVPVTDPVFDLVRAEVEASANFVDGGARITVHLKNHEDGSFHAQAPRDAGVAIDDYVFLDDSSWPRTAQSMIIGTVRSIVPDADTPVLVNLVIRPVYAPERLNAVTIKIEKSALAEGSQRE